MRRKKFLCGLGIMNLGLLVIFTACFCGPFSCREIYALAAEGSSSGFYSPGRDKEYLAKYRGVINGYLDEAIALINGAGDYGQEALANQIGPLATPISLDPQAKEYQKMQSEINDALQEYKNFEQQMEGIKNKENSDYLEASLPYPITAYPAYAFGKGLFYRQKAAESPYPYIAHDSGSWPNVSTSWTPRNTSYDAAYVNAITRMDAKIVQSFLKYLRISKTRINRQLAWDFWQPAPKSKFIRAKELAKASYELAQKITDLNLPVAQKYYQLQDELYQAYKANAEAEFGLLLDLMPGTMTLDGGWQWVETTGDILRVDWTKIAFTKLEGTVTVSVPADWSYENRAPFQSSVVQASDCLVGLQTRYRTDADCEMCTEEVKAAGKLAIQFYNAYYDNLYSYYTTLITQLNSIYEKYKPYLPDRYHGGYLQEQLYAEDDASHREKSFAVVYPTDREFKITSPPVAEAGTYLAQKEYDRVTLDARRSSDPQNSVLTYRWVITEMPENDFKVSQYVLYQTIGKGAQAPVTPDLPGQWKAEVVVRNSKGAKATDSATLPVKQRTAILCIQHSDDLFNPATGLGMELRLYQPDATTVRGKYKFEGESDTCLRPCPLDGPYYLEVAHEKAGVYSAIAKDGKPINPVILGPPPVKQFSNGVAVSYVFSTFERSTSFYTGTEGTSNLKSWCPFKPGVYPPTWDESKFNREVYRITGDFTLASAPVAGQPSFAEIEVEVVDPQITHLLLPGFTAPQQRGADGKLKGTYRIKQHLDYFSWERPPGGNTLIAYPRPNGVPDWMEQGAVDGINLWQREHPGYNWMKYLKEIGIEDKRAGRAPSDKPGLILLNPKFRPLRFNLNGEENPDQSGFVCSKQLYSAAVHELAHRVYTDYQKFHPECDMDKDTLIRRGSTAASEIFPLPRKYAYDVAENGYKEEGASPERSVSGQATISINNEMIPADGRIIKYFNVSGVSADDLLMVESCGGHSMATASNRALYAAYEIEGGDENNPIKGSRVKVTVIFKQAGVPVTIELTLDYKFQVNYWKLFKDKDSGDDYCGREPSFRATITTNTPYLSLPTNMPIKQTSSCSEPAMAGTRIFDLTDPLSPKIRFNWASSDIGKTFDFHYTLKLPHDPNENDASSVEFNARYTGPWKEDTS